MTLGGLKGERQGTRSLVLELKGKSVSIRYDFLINIFEEILWWVLGIYSLTLCFIYFKEQQGNKELGTHQ